MTDTQSIKDRLDIIQIVGEYTKLKKSGANWKGNCPFHHEKTPSFMVHPERQFWHCFGCGKGGDVFSFIQEIEGLQFVEALKLLAQRAGVQLTNSVSEVNQSQRNRILEIISSATNFFHHILMELPAAEPARAYLKNRELKTETIRQWRVGFAPEQWDLLTKYLLKKGYGIDDIIAAGLTVKREGADASSGRGFYDRFRGRVMFPISDPHGTVVGFTGRVLVETEKSGGKYVNTPQTIVYDKSRVVYGLHNAKQEIKTKDLAILVEGQMDVLACHEAGMKNVVAASGTALTPEQIKLLKRYTHTVAMAFDADTAGQKAGERGIALALQEGLTVKVIVIPPGLGKDADECIRKNPAAWFKAVAEAPGFMDWYFEQTFKNYNSTDSRSKQTIAEILLNQIRNLSYSIEREDWLKKLSDRLGLDASILREEIKKAPRLSVTAPTQKHGAKDASPIQTKNVSTLEMLRQELWSLILQFPAQYGAVVNSIKPEFFAGTPYAALYEAAQKLYTSNSSLNLDAIREEFAHPGEENMVDLLSLRPYRDAMELTESFAMSEIKQLIDRITQEVRRDHRKLLEQALRLAEEKGDNAAVQEVMVKLQGL